MTLSQRDKWLASVIKKYGSVEEMRTFFAESAKRNKSPRYGYFKHLAESDPEKLRKLAQKGGKRGKRRTK